jgi:hypothetical protein
MGGGYEAVEDSPELVLHIARPLGTAKLCGGELATVFRWTRWALTGTEWGYTIRPAAVGGSELICYNY